MVCRENRCTLCRNLVRLKQLVQKAQAYAIYQVMHKILPNFLVPNKTRNNASMSTKIVPQNDRSILIKF